ncbi:predicted protein [Lichtheimia corymbifera JMRC:FSU:9682]|uniref:Uncharacterized protein n=1 Tax=Lichtheimia corymbifera JMRC:FSU:9682 TaxID=1263082 RepID=A0A068S9X1_9FUNG|nr:predicted protein [Lichtheimia corymbifera JMRC:FSU:9682]
MNIDPTHRESFQVYRTQDNNNFESDSNSSASQEDFITRTELTFDTMEQAPGQAARAPTVEEQMVALMAGMQELLRNNQRNTSSIRPRLPEPDSFAGDRSPGGVESWVRTVERYLELSSWEEHQWVPYAVMKLPSMSGPSSVP